MQGFFNSSVFKTALFFFALAVAGLAIWFLGPLIGVNDAFPLAGIGTRVILIILLFLLIVFLMLDWNISAIGVAALSLLVWFAAPCISFNSKEPFAPIWTRVLVISLIFLIYLGYSIYKLLQVARADSEFLGRIFRGPSRNELNPAREEIRSLQTSAQRAISQLRNMHKNVSGTTGFISCGLKRLFEGKKYLYELPWYVIIGNPGVGKTTVLLNSGLKFPASDQIDIASIASSQMVLPNKAGTINCSWWFANEAVLLDTAGRYTSQEDGKGWSPTASDEVRIAKIDEHKDGKEDSGAQIIGTTPPASVNKNAAEWQGFLGMLRKVRPRAPINGALVALDAESVLNAQSQERAALVAKLRARLEELRGELGICFPVYVLVTKTDLIKGFADYFSNLTGEGRAQVWGFTLPWEGNSENALSSLTRRGKLAAKSKQQSGSLRESLEGELDLLRTRLSDGLPARLQEEYDLDRRKRLYALPQEFGAFSSILLEMLGALFVDSRFDTTQLGVSLRGVYFTSALQSSANLLAEPNSFMARLGRFARLTPSKVKPDIIGNRSFFIHDVLARVVFSESHLVRPNLRWEARHNLLRFTGHLAVILLFIFFVGGLTFSYANNKEYLNSVANRISALKEEAAICFASYSPIKSKMLIDNTVLLPVIPGFEMTDPPLEYRFGLYSHSYIEDATRKALMIFQNRLILPQINLRMEQVMRNAVVRNNSVAAYETLRAYLMLHDTDKFNSNDVLTWVLRDWQGEFNFLEGVGETKATTTRPTQNISVTKFKHPGKSLPLRSAASDSTALPNNLSMMFGNQPGMITHFQNMFSGGRVVLDPEMRNETLVAQVRDFLDKNSQVVRLYERIKASLTKESPPDFTLLTAVGPQAGNVFVLASGASIEMGVPGLFTYKGYHEVFDKHLGKLIEQAQRNDAWVMGRGLDTPNTIGGSEKRKSIDRHLLGKDGGVEGEILHLYLSEYAEVWEAFLSDIRPVISGRLDLDLKVVGQLAAPNSPLARLAQAAARETTLARDLNAATDTKEILTEKAIDRVVSRSGLGGAGLIDKRSIMYTQTALERQYVDDQFAALREVVTGHSGSLKLGSAGQATGVVSGGATKRLADIIGDINELYSAMAISSTAIKTGSMPSSPVAEVTTRIRMDAGKLPSPFKMIITTLGDQAKNEVDTSTTSVLRMQAQAQKDSLVSMMNSKMTTMCRQYIEGRYPFAQNSQEVAIEDFNAFFSAGGVADEFFTKFIQPLVNTNTRPWRYKTPAQIEQDGIWSAARGGGGTGSTTVMANGANAPSLAGELVTLLTKTGPDPEVFHQIEQIREMFFRDPGQKRMAWKFEVRVMKMDPSIEDFLMDFDGQTHRYVHGPVVPFNVTWPGPRGGATVDMIALPRIRPETSTLSARGPWAALRVFQTGRIAVGAPSDKVVLEYPFDDRKVSLGINSLGGPNPLTSKMLNNFKCP